MKTKICSKCGKELPATTEYFYRSKAVKCGLRARCKECNRQCREENKERKAEYNRKYREENKERIAECDRKYRGNNKTKLLEYGRKYREENKEYYRKYREDNEERMAEYSRQYREENRELFRSYNIRRRSLERNLPSTLTASQWQHAQSYFNHSCAYCGSVTALEQDHFWPLSEGGGYTATNIIPACRSCNASKNNKPFEEWYPTHESYSPEREAKIYEYFEQLALENGGWGRRRYDLGVVTIEVSHEDL